MGFQLRANVSSHPTVIDQERGENPESQRALLSERGLLTYMELR